MRCPRCQRDSRDGTVFCPGCGAPLSLVTESQAALDATVDLDRRAGGVPEPAEAGASTRTRPPPAAAAPIDRAVLAPPPLPRERASAGNAHAPRTSAPSPGPEGSRQMAPLPDAELSQWDMRLSAIPREQGPGVERAAPLPLPPEDLRTEPRPAPRPPLSSEATRRSPQPAAPPRAHPSANLGAGEPPTVEIDVGPLEIALERAPDWRRICAWILDGVPFLALFGLVLRYALDRLPHPPLEALGYLDLAVTEARDVTGPIFASVVVLYAVYHALSHGLSGATLGKRLLGLRVVTRSGRRPGMGRAAIRATLAGVSVAIVGLGVLLALFTRSGRGLHDFLARTWVVKAP